ncbi:RnfABCDGE type electron transport complex subunit D [Calothrix sp. 336/3]|uniref:RnfABCDGE type electron transport complex subunit D n=1 Tax=Calothrix sp. 336/3 TaxID=1337936 RepID=UPI00054DD2AC|nr:RnfABCDGE type electron transport complex subunit D [Calothrix sp. 336/3]AKG19997.1 Na+-transporting NADH:ubiquinone oxidoreductase, subunit NqrB [Calothrix sp. 336/3]
MLFQDIRDYQILYLSLFLVLGIGTRDWTLHPEFIPVLIITCLSTQWLWCYCLRNPQEANNWMVVRSPLITSLGLSLLLRADHWTAIAIAGVTAISSKFIFRVGDKHFFNPGNFGIISALVLTNNAWVSPGQWGEEWWYGLLFLGTGGMMLRQVGRWDTTAAFLAAYAALEGVRNYWLGWTIDVYLHRLMSGSLILFALFMITDPRSIPDARIGRILWAICIALVTFILRNYFYMTTAVFWALFAIAPLTVLVDFLWRSPRFTWKEPSINQDSLTT